MLAYTSTTTYVVNWCRVHHYTRLWYHYTREVVFDRVVFGIWPNGFYFCHIIWGLVYIYAKTYPLAPRSGLGLRSSSRVADMHYRSLGQVRVRVRVRARGSLKGRKSDSGFETTRSNTKNHSVKYCYPYVYTRTILH